MKIKIEYLFNKEKEVYDVVNVEGYDKTVVIPNEYEGKPVAGIGEWAFEECFSLEEVCLPDTITEIKENAFNNCQKLVTAFTYGHSFSLDKLEVKRGNANLLMSNITCFGGEPIVNEKLDNWFKDKNPLLLESNEIFLFESIHYLRAALAKWAREKGLRAHWIYCDELNIDDTVQYSSPKDCDFVVLDSVDSENDDEYRRYISNVIYRSIVDEIPIIGLVKNTKKDHEQTIRLFQKHEIVFDERLEILNNNLELKGALSVLSDSKRISISTLQKEMNIGFNKAKRIFDTLVELKFIQQTNNKCVLKIDI